MGEGEEASTGIDIATIGSLMSAHNNTTRKLALGNCGCVSASELETVAAGREEGGGRQGEE